MSINELFKLIQEKSDTINGEYELQHNEIIWTYCLDELDCDEDFIDDDDMFGFSFETNEEQLLAAYDEDVLKLEAFLDEQQESYNWELSETKSVDSIITFNISPSLCN